MWDEGGFRICGGNFVELGEEHERKRKI